MTDFTDFLELFKQRRRDAVRQLPFDDEHTTAAQLADIQACITAIDAVMAGAPPPPAEYKIHFVG